MNKDIDLYFSALTNVEAAKLLAARSHFQNPFVWVNSEQFFKVNRKIRYLVGENRYSFEWQNFIPSYFNEDKVALTGGTRAQRGGVQTRAQKLRRAGDNSTNPAVWDSILDDIIAERTSDKNYEIAAHRLPPAIPAVIDGDIDRYDLIIWSANAGVDTASLNRTPFFIYLYIQIYHPEIFTYARVVATAIGNRGITAFPPNFETYTLDYTINDDKFTIRRSDAGVPDHDTLKALTLQAIGLAMRFVDEFPALQTENLMDFLELFRPRRAGAVVESHVSSAIPDLRNALSGRSFENEFYSAASAILQQGGSEIPTSNPLFDAMDLYEIYYAYKIRAAYEDRELTKEEQKQLEKVAATSYQKNQPMISSKKPAPILNAIVPIATAFGGKRFKKTKKRKINKKKRQTRRVLKRISKK